MSLFGFICEQKKPQIIAIKGFQFHLMLSSDEVISYINHSRKEKTFYELY